jgi:curli biogenesis system outer membrane secretion channel CsgG
VTATVHPFPGAHVDDYATFPLRVHAGDDTGPVIARFDGLGLKLLQAMTARMDLTVVDVRTNRVVAVGGPILGQLQIDPDALTT